MLARELDADDHTNAGVPGRTNAAAARTSWAEISVALVAFGFLCVVVLTRASSLIEPDDFAYRASIVALSHGHVLLTNAQYHALVHQFSSLTQPGVYQWDHLKNGEWISEKNPGYPFFAVIFSWLSALRVAPLFYGALASTGLFVGARRWLGPWGGTWAAGLFCTSGAALAFAWRATMPTFTDASLIAAGAGALLWALLATDASRRRRTVVGLAAFLALEGAVFIRYTNVVELIVAVAAVVVLARRCVVHLSAIATWLGSVALFAAGDMIFNALVYGGPLSTGYGAGEITFSVSSFWPNVVHMPSSLVAAMPMTLLALAAIAGVSWRVIARAPSGDPFPAALRDGTVAGVLVVGWAGIWGLYAMYTWTVQVNFGPSIHVIRFYLPALGLIALLGAWLLSRVPVVVSLIVLALLAGWGDASFHSLLSGTSGPRGRGPGGFGGPGGRGGIGGPGGPVGSFGGGPTGPPVGSGP